VCVFVCEGERVREIVCLCVCVFVCVGVCECVLKGICDCVCV